MSKKVIALSLVIVLLATTFAACGKKPTIEINGRDFVPVTDEEGNTVANDSGDIAVHVTDENGKYVKDENGEPQTNYVEISDRIINGDTIETKEFKFTLPLDGWVAEDGQFVKEESEGKATISVSKVYSAGGEKTFDEFINDTTDTMQEYIDTIKTDYPQSALNRSEAKVTDKQIDASVVECYVKTADGKIETYIYTVYFEINGDLYTVEYTAHGEYYDSLIKIIDIMNGNFIIK